MDKIRLYLVPEPNKPQRVVEVAADALILDRGEFKTPQTAEYVALSDVTDPSQSPDTIPAALNNVLICWREPVSDDIPDDPTVIEVPNPIKPGEPCQCGYTCFGPKISYLNVKTVFVPV